MRPIDADALYIDYLYPTTTTGTTCHAYVSQIQINSAPTIEPQRMRGRWVDKNNMEGAWNYCSICGEQAIDLYDFCPNCGADMRGEQE